MTEPYLCECGELIDVDGIDATGAFQCPHCERSQDFDPTDPGLLRNYRSDGVYDLLLERKVGQQSLAAAIRVARENARDASSAAAPRTKPGFETRSVAIGEDLSRTSDTAESPTDDRSDGKHSTKPNVMPTSMLRENDRLGPFAIERVLGQGGMGIVYRAFDHSLERPVALKVLSEIHAANGELVDRFQREARAAGALTHPNITHIYSIGQERGLHYFAMEFVAGDTLANLILRHGQLQEDIAVDYLMQVARGLRAAKQKEIIHRDIKPSNLILSEDGIVKITDFGLAKVISSPSEITATGVIIGTPLYMSPEQGKGEPLDHRSDIYSLGCSFYHLLSGVPPFEGDSAMKIIVSHITEDPPRLGVRDPSIHPKVIEIIEKMMSKNPLDRYQDYAALIDALTQLRGPSGSNSSTRIDSRAGRIVLMSEAEDALSSCDPIALRKLSVADVNLDLGRHDKALTLYESVLAEHPELEVDLGFRILKILQQRGDDDAMHRQWLERILARSADQAERFYCRWKLLSQQLASCHQMLSSVASALDGVLHEEFPPEIESRRLRQRSQEFKDIKKKLARDRQATIMLIKRSGELQLELD